MLLKSHAPTAALATLPAPAAPVVLVRPANHAPPSDDAAHAISASGRGRRSSPPPSPMAKKERAVPSPRVARTGTFLEEDLIDPRSLPRIELAELREEISQGLAASAVGSSKHHRATYRGWPNEDKVFLQRTRWTEGDVSVEALFAGVFDGHGGEGLASEFVANHLHENFCAIIANQDPVLSRNERVCAALQAAFVKTDCDLYTRVKGEAENAKLVSKVKGCKCKFFLEEPCACLNPPIAANEGSTGTVVIVTGEDIFCANIGDSDAVLFSRSADRSHESSSPSQDSRKRGKFSPGLKHERLTVTDTPLVDEANEDFLRIRKIAQARRSHHKAYEAPRHGILVSDKASRFNYVAVPGARSLNMTRAFGNLGHKVMRNGSLVEEESPIISRPHVVHMIRSSAMHSIVVGSDGLWDNIDLDDIEAVASRLGNLQTAAASQSVVKELLRLSVASKRKPDDIAIVFIPLPEIGTVP